jgi:hypothetical protein
MEEGNKQSMAFYLDLLGNFSIACDQMETGVWCQEPQGEVDCDQFEDAGEDGELTSNVISPKGCYGEYAHCSVEDHHL